MNKLYDVNFENMSFDVLEFIERLEVNADWAKLMVAHIYLDHILTLYIYDHLPRAEVYLTSGHRGFAEKLSLCIAHGLLDDDISAVLKSINACRNKFAHKLIFSIPSEVKKDLFRSYTQVRSSDEVLEKDGFGNFLFTIVLMAEIQRQAVKKSAAIQKDIIAAKGELYQIVTELLAQKWDRKG